MGRLHILLVDTDLHMHERLQQALGEVFSVHCVASLADAKQFLQMQQQLPDILISEVLLSQENGLELCRYIRDTPALRTIPVMFLTSHATLQDKVAGFRAGADDYVVKPFDTRHLVSRIKLLSRIKRLERRTGT